MSETARSTSEDVESGPTESLLSLTRAILVAILVLTVANGVFLYFFPSRADTGYAWPIRPPVNAAYMGAGYLGGGLTIVVVLWLLPSWRAVRAAVPGIAALAALMFVATLVHRDRFDWDFPPTWLWAATYAAIPPVAIVVWRIQNRAERQPSSPEPGVEQARIGAGIASVAVLVLVVAMFVFPEDLLGHTPWPMSPLLVRIDAGWYALLAGTLVSTALLARERRDLIIPFASTVIWAALTLPLPLLYADDVLTDRTGFWIWLALQVAVLVGSLGIALWAWRSVREARQRL